MPLPSRPIQSVRALRVAMLVANTGTSDARVRKEAESLVSAGHAVTVFCLAGRGLPAVEQLSGVTYRRCREWHRGGAAGPVAEAAGASGQGNFLSNIKELIEPFVPRW